MQLCGAIASSYLQFVARSLAFAWVSKRLLLLQYQVVFRNSLVKLLCLSTREKDQDTSYVLEISKIKQAQKLKYLRSVLTYDGICGTEIRRGKSAFQTPNKILRNYT